MIEQVILPVVATGTDGSFRPVGSCWIFSINGRDALAFSAAHIFEEIVRSEGRHKRAAASMPNILRPLKSPAVALASTRLKAIYRYRIDRALVLDIPAVHRDGLADVAVCEITFQSDAPQECRFERKMAIHAGPIPPNTEVAATGYAGMGKTVSHTNEDGTGWAKHFRQLTIEHGKCIEYYPQRGPRGPSGPCFEIDVRSQHGMSGGPILHKKYGDEIVSCGVISRGGYSSNGNDNTIASALWPAYSFKIESLRDEDDKPLTLVDLASRGWIDDKSNGPAHFQMLRAPDEENGIIAWL